MEITKEIKAQAKACQTTEELISLAKENAYELSPEEAELFLQDFAEGELADEELDNVAGGSEGCQPPNKYEDVYWDKKEDVQFIFNIGDTVEAFAFACFHHTATCTVTDRKVDYSSGKYKYHDSYFLEQVPGSKAAFVDGWFFRSRIEK